MLVNYMEVIIDQQLPEILKKYDFKNQCTCDRCIEDIKALALNHLKPLYVASNEGIIYSRINELAVQFNVDIIREIVRAIEVVLKNPKHTFNE